MGLPAFLGVGGLEALEIEFGNIISPDLAQEELDILQQMIHPNNQAELVLSFGSSLQASNPDSPKTPPKGVASPQKSRSPKKPKGKQKAASPAPSEEGSGGLSSISISNLEGLPATSTPAHHMASTGHPALGFDFSLLEGGRSHLEEEFGSFLDDLINKDGPEKSSNSANRLPAAAQSSSAPPISQPAHVSSAPPPSKPPAPRKQPNLFMPPKLSNQLRHNQPSDSHLFAQVDRETANTEWPSAAEVSLMTSASLVKLRESCSCFSTISLSKTVS
jgi:hypothetical protein